MPDASPKRQRRERAPWQERDPLRLMGVTELARTAGVSDDTAKEWVDQGLVASVQCGDLRKVPMRALEDFYDWLVEQNRARLASAPRAIGRGRLRKAG